MESGFSMAVGIDHLFGPILFGDLCKRALILQNVCRRIMQEHQIFSITGFSGCLKRLEQPVCFPLHQLSGLFFVLFVPAKNSASSVQVKRSFKTVTFGSYKCVVFITVEIVLKETQLSTKVLVQCVCLLRIPIMIMISAQQNLFAGKCRNVLHVELTLCQILPEAVVSGQNKSIIRLQHTFTVFSKHFFMITPGAVSHLKFCL